MSRKKYDYAALDASWGFRLDRRTLARESGFKTVTEMYHQAYLDAGSFKRAAITLQCSEDHARLVMHHIGAEINPRGGVHYSKIPPALITKLRYGWDRFHRRHPDSLKIAYLRAFREQWGLSVTIGALRQALNGVRWQHLPAVKHKRRRR